ncbi:MAG TPA: hypothetical protein VGO80_20920 [Solirubrobacteraceae bacterium]|nr:hypothetical protein [Solirubrobacteraceae bacterium]
MPHPQARAWWADVQHLRDGYDRTDEARRRADEADLASRRATRERRHVEAEVSTVHAPADADYADALASLRDASATSGDAFAGPRGAHDAFAGPREARDAFAGPRAGREARDSQRDAFAGPRDAIAAPRRADATFVGRRGRIDGGFDPRRGHHVDLPPAPRVRQGIATPSGLDRPPRVKGDATPGRVTVEIRGRTVPAPAVPRSVEVDRRRPQRRAIERVGARPDRMAMWALLMGLLLILVAIGTADTPAASSLLLIFR